jgi:serine phosphatase RsbU (regulator of sigma subunit)
MESRLMDTVAAHSGEPADALMDGILASVLAFSKSGHFDDDVCMLGVDIVPK